MLWGLKNRRRSKLKNLHHDKRRSFRGRCLEPAPAMLRSRRSRLTLSILVLVYDCRLIKKPEGGTKVEVKMTLTAPGCGMGPAIAHDAQSKILTIDGIDEADVQLVWDPPWNQNMISEAGRMKLGMV